MERVFQEMQMKDMLRMYNGLVERCFEKCITKFSGNDLESRETACLQNCTGKYFEGHQRLTQAFATEMDTAVPGATAKTGFGGV